jgi:outer membrane protein insertion porin family
VRFFPAVFLLLPLFLAGVSFASESGEETILSGLKLRGQEVKEVQISGSELSKNIRERIQALAWHEFNPQAIRALLVWAHGNGGDAFIDVKVKHAPEGVVLLVEVKQKIKIAKVEFSGNAEFSSKELEQFVDVKEGVEYEPELKDNIAKNISLAYSKKGYMASQVKVDFDLESRVMKVQIVEGEPTLISSVDISPLDTVKVDALRNRYENDIREAFGLYPGDRVAREKVLDGIQAIKDWLRDHDFLMARDPALEYHVTDDGRVALKLNIIYGQRIRFGFRGNNQFSYRELLAMVGDVKEVSSGSDYLASVRRRVLEEYRNIGFANATITTLVNEDSRRGIRYVSLVVKEGSKVRVSGIEIEGVRSMSPDDAEKELTSLGSRLVQRGFLDENGLTHAAELFADKLRANGYLSAKLESVNIVYPDLENSDAEHPEQDRSKPPLVKILFTEGIQTTLKTANIVGVSSLEAGEVKEMLGLQEGNPFNIFAFERGLQTLKDRYEEFGNFNMQVTNESSESIVRYSRDNSEVYIRVEVDEGPVSKVGDIKVEGVKKTHPRVITRELPFQKGEVFTSSLKKEAEDNLRKLNLFSTVNILHKEHPGSEDVMDILVLVDESEPGTFDIVPGIRNDLGLRLGFELGYNNLGGWNRGVFAKAILNRRLQDYYSYGDDDWKRPEYQFSVGFREPWLANMPVLATSNLDFLRRQYKSFDAAVRKVSLGLKRDLTRLLSGFTEYSYEQVKIDHVRAPYDPAVDARTYFIGTVTPGFVIDSRDESFNPSKGLHSVNRFEVASRWFGSEADVGYTRSTTQNSVYFRVHEDIVLAMAVNMGWERSNIAGQPIPSYKLFRLGGMGSIRGYNEDEIETLKIIKGSLGMINYRSELRVPLTGNFGSAFFLDAGNLMIDRLSLSPDALRSAVGAGLRYKTPVGPVVLDFAWRLQTDALVGDTCVTQITNTITGERGCTKQPTDRYKIHFAIGAF